MDTSSNPEHTFQGNQGTPHGWYLSTAAPESVLRKLNQELLEVKINGVLQEIMDRSTGVSGGFSCASKKLSIAVEVLMIPYAFITAPIVIIIFILLAAFTMKKNGRGSQGKNTIGSDFNSGKSYSTHLQFWRKQVISRGACMNPDARVAIGEWK